MKVIIEVTKDGYSKTVENSDGTKLVQSWERSGHGFSTTDDSINFEDTDLLEETIEALQCDFDLGDLCDALENEEAELYDEDEVHTTDDGHILKRGDTFYTVATTSRDEKWISIPLKMKFPLDWGSHGTYAFFSREKCVEKCDKENLEE